MTSSPPPPTLLSTVMVSAHTQHYYHPTPAMLAMPATIQPALTCPTSSPSSSAALLALLQNKSRGPPPAAPPLSVAPPSIPSISSSPTTVYASSTTHRQIPLHPSSASPPHSFRSSPTSSHPPPPSASSFSAPASRRSSASSSSASTSSPSPPSALNHSSLDRSTPAYTSHRPSLHYEGDSLDGSYSFVLSAPASAGASPPQTPLGRPGEGLEGRAPPPMPSSMRPTASPPHRPESPSVQPPPASLYPSVSSVGDAGGRRVEAAAVRGGDDAKTVEFYLKQAIQASDAAAMTDLVEKASKLNVNPTLLNTAHNMLAEKRTENLHTLLFYLKHSLETKNREGIKMALDKLTPLIDHLDSTTRANNPDLLPLVEEGRRVLVNLDKESAQTVHFYLKQGIQLRNRDVIKQSLDKTPSVPPELLDKELTNAAHALLMELDAQHLIRGYLMTAIKQKDELALEQALEEAKKLKMGGEVAEVTEGYKLVAELRARGQKKQKKWRTNGGAKKTKEEKFNLFGGPLIEAVRRSDQPIPKICYQCMDYLRATALCEAGLFRVAGNKDAIELIRQQYEEGDGEVKLEDVHDVAGVFKLYLRMLPEPLIPYDKYDQFIRIGLNKDKSRTQQRNAEIRDLLATLPPENYALLYSLARFLVDVAKHSELNKMTPENLAIVFAPNLIRPALETANTMLYDMPIAINIIASLILHIDDIFTHPPATAITQPNAAPTFLHSSQPSHPSALPSSSSSSASASSSTSSFTAPLPPSGPLLSSTLPGPLYTTGRKVVNSQTL